MHLRFICPASEIRCNLVLSYTYSIEHPKKISNTAKKDITLNKNEPQKEDLTVTSVTDLINIITTHLPASIPNKNRINSENKFYFRGESATYKLRTPTLYRNKNLTTDSSNFYYTSLMNELGKNNYSNGTELFQTLSELQHYEALTRMLDVTLNPLVALYFATGKAGDDDGQIFFYTSKGKNKRTGKHKAVIYDNDLTASILATLNFIPRAETRKFILVAKSLRKHLSEENKKFVYKTDETPIRKAETSYIFETLKNSSRRGSFLKKLEGENLDFSFIRVKTPGLKEFVIEEFKKRGILNLDKNFKVENHRDALIEIEEELFDDLKDFIEIFLEKITVISNSGIKFKYPLAIVEDITSSHIIITTKLTDRIRQQNGAFIYPCYPQNSEYDSIITEINTSIKNLSVKHENKDLIAKIPYAYKDSIRQELSLLGITDGYIYADIRSASNSITMP